MNVVKFHQYEMVVTVRRTDDSKSTADLIQLCFDAPKDCPASWLRVEREHCRKFPRPMLRFVGADHAVMECRFVVPRRWSAEEFHAGLKVVLEKNGWTC